MAQNYEIDIMRFNGQDYDTLLPTPADHASTHQANGSDPLTLQSGNYGSLSIPTSAYQNASVTRAKLARDALYSPVVLLSANRHILPSDIGATLIARTDRLSITLTLDFDDSVILPTGTTIAFVRAGDQADLSIAFSGAIYVFSSTSGEILRLAPQTEATIVKLPFRFAQIALKKMSSTEWLLFGDVEVVQ